MADAAPTATAATRLRIRARLVVEAVPVVESTGATQDSAAFTLLECTQNQVGILDRHNDAPGDQPEEEEEEEEQDEDVSFLIPRPFLPCLVNRACLINACPNSPLLRTFVSSLSSGLCGLLDILVVLSMFWPDHEMAALFFLIGHLSIVPLVILQMASSIEGDTFFACVSSSLLFWTEAVAHLMCFFGVATATVMQIHGWAPTALAVGLAAPFHIVRLAGGDATNRTYHGTVFREIARWMLGVACWVLVYGEFSSVAHDARWRRQFDGGVAAGAIDPFGPLSPKVFFLVGATVALGFLTMRLALHLRDATEERLAPFSFEVGLQWITCSFRRRRLFATADSRRQLQLQQQQQQQQRSPLKSTAARVFWRKGTAAAIIGSKMSRLRSDKAKALAQLSRMKELETRDRGGEGEEGWRGRPRSPLFRDPSTSSFAAVADDGNFSPDLEDREIHRSDVPFTGQSFVGNPRRTLTSRIIVPPQNPLSPMLNANEQEMSRVVAESSRRSLFRGHGGDDDGDDDGDKKSSSSSSDGGAFGLLVAASPPSSGTFEQQQQQVQLPLQRPERPARAAVWTDVRRKVVDRRKPTSKAAMGGVDEEL